MISSTELSQTAVDEENACVCNFDEASSIEFVLVMGMHTELMKDCLMEVPEPVEIVLYVIQMIVSFGCQCER